MIFYIYSPKELVTTNHCSPEPKTPNPKTLKP